MRLPHTRACTRSGFKCSGALLKTDAKPKLLYFNCLVNIMTQVDTLKQTHRAEYDQDNNGRRLLADCSRLLDKADALKLSLQPQ